ncbi:MAG: rhomboid family intramembrane serine protease [Planctomycetota bacterium]
MFIPLGTDRPLRRPAVVTYSLMALNVAIHLLVFFLDRSNPDPAAYAASAFVLHPAGGSGWHTWLTYAFLHDPSGLMHLLGNMLFLWVFGQAVEDRLGRIGFAAFYLVGAVATGGAHVLFSSAPVIGASGAIACATGAYMVLFPRANVRIISIFGLWSLPALWFIGLAIAWDLFMAAAGGGRIAYAAHLGGYAYGSAIAFGLLATRLIEREPYDLFTALRQARRREKIRGAMRSAGLDNPMARSRKERRADEAPEDPVEAYRRAIRSALRERRSSAAVAAYRKLVLECGEAAADLGRDHQYEVANILYQKGEHELAAMAYDRFLQDHPRDHEAPMVRVLLGRLHARTLRDPDRARTLLREALADLEDPSLREVAVAELDALAQAANGGREAG